MSDEFFSIEQAAAKLRLDVRWLDKWVYRHPFARDGQPHYSKIGKQKIFSLRMLTLIYYQLRDTGIIKEQIDIWDGMFFERADLGEMLGFIYFVASADSVKIGFSLHLERRIASLKTSAAANIELLHSEPGTLDQEKCFHRHFSSIREHGEWFRKTPELLAFIEQRKSLRGQ